MFKKFFSNCKESFQELVYKTTWPSGKELAGSAITVLIASLLIAVVVFIMDKAFQGIMTTVYP
ncbi:MAG: preprotein translocase subunit SecE [Bacteroidaceae bacterium]|nr:preprotein translocase subunit SecE [Bacteroidaceae bacterium]